ncbi:hypothetical protein J5Y03_12480 [Bacillus sp. RG28]|uniref:Lipoprotein n=1 Tax=Gottfriedia endophytica TaxID=2820819 RepID=A0A940SKF9_9BACI|nr:hypothetical protein [Gottfriedia endophytica]MBP0725989.1 hypothetical protein [Gottfriedia endophytica]
MKIKLVIGINLFLLVFILSACSIKKDEPSLPLVDVKDSNINLNGDEPPLPKVLAGNSNIEVVRDSYGWEGVSVDRASAPDSVKDKTPTIVAKGVNIKIEFDFNLMPTVINIYRVNENRKVEEKSYNNNIKAPTEKGIYYYDIFVGWNASDDVNASIGSSEYSFVIEIK